MCDLRWWKHDEEEMCDLMLVDADEAKFQEYLIMAIYELGMELNS